MGMLWKQDRLRKPTGSFLALDHVNIHVRKGCIYALWR